MAPLKSRHHPRLIDRDEVVRDPRGVAAYLIESSAVFGLTAVDVRVAAKHMVVYWLTLEPWTPMAARGYPTERISISVWPTGAVTAVPIGGSGRTWQHRNAFVLGRLDRIGDLCLWFSSDPPALRWRWNDGFVAYVTVVHRHLQAEEYFRRTGRWPAEDAPHGAGDHPIRSSALRQVAQEAVA